MKQSQFKLRSRRKSTIKIKSRMGIASGKFYSCEWMAGDIYKVALNVILKLLEAGKDEKEPRVFLQWLTRGSWCKARWQKYLHHLQMQGDIQGHHRWSQSDNKGDKGNTQHPRQKPEQTRCKMTMMKWPWSRCPNSRNQEKEMTNWNRFLYKVGYSFVHLWKTPLSDTDHQF